MARLGHPRGYPRKSTAILRMVALGQPNSGRPRTNARAFPPIKRLLFGSRLRVSLLFNLRHIADPDKTILAGDCQRAVGALRLGNTEDPVVAGVVNFDMIAVLDSQSSGEHRIPKVILCAD
jgi:hypothetical protein